MPNQRRFFTTTDSTVETLDGPATAALRARSSGPAFFQLTDNSEDVD
jgi:hypothetical protein